MTLRLRRTALLVLALFAALAWLYRPIFKGEALACRDVFRLFIPDSAYLRDALLAGEVPLWTPYPRLGQPFAAALHTQVFYPPRGILALAFGSVWGVTFGQLLHAALAAMGVYVCARALRRSQAGSALAAAAFALGPSFTGLACQRNVVDALAWSGFIVWSTERLVRRPSLTRSAPLAVFLALSLLAGSPETTLWQLVLCAVLLVSGRRARQRPVIAIAVATREAARPASSPLLTRSERRRIFLGALAVVWAAAMAAVTLVPALEFTRDSRRVLGGMSTLSWSVSWAQFVSIFWPLADEPRGEYWGEDQYFFRTLFAGGVVMLLGLAGALRWRRTWPLALVGGGCALLSLGTNLPPAAWLLTSPPFSLFRFPVKAFGASLFCICVLAAYGTDLAAYSLGRLRRTRLRLAASIGMTFVVLGIGTLLLRWLSVRAGMAGGFLWFALAVGAVAFAALVLSPSSPTLHPGVSPQLLRRQRWLLAGFATAELALATWLLYPPYGYIDSGRLERPSVLAADLEHRERVTLSVNPLAEDVKAFGGTGDEYMAMSRDALLPNRMSEEQLRSLEGYGAPEPLRLEALLEAPSRKTYDVLGVTHFVRRGAAPFEDVKAVASGTGLPTLWRSPSAFPRAYVVHAARRVSDQVALDALGSLGSEPHDFAAEVLLAEGPELPAQPPCSPAASVLRLDAGFQSLHVEVESCGKGYLVVNDSHAPGWRAWVDDQPTPLYRANLVVRAIPVPPGRHVVVMRYEPASARWGLLVTLLAIAALLATAWGGDRLRRTTRKAPAAASPPGGSAQ